MSGTKQPTEILSRNSEGLVEVSSTIVAAFAPSIPTEEARILFVSTHGPDAAIGAGMAIALATEAGADVHVAIVTDGSMSYSDPRWRKGLSARRFHEGHKVYAALGVIQPNIYSLGFPDAGLHGKIGRYPFSPGGDQCDGLEHAFVRLLRRVRPTVILLPCGEDFHPDSRAVYMELHASLFLAASGIWRELGEPIPHPPAEILVWPTYVRPVSNPSVYISAAPDLFTRKQAAVKEWMAGHDWEGENTEFFWRLKYHAYDPRDCAAAFGR